MEAKSGGGDDIQPASGIGKTGEQGHGPRAADWSQVKELLDAGLVDDMTEAFLLERDVDVVRALPGHVGGVERCVGCLVCGEGTGGLPWIKKLN